jgi:hypothetical protein
MNPEELSAMLKRVEGQDASPEIGWEDTIRKAHRSRSLHMVTVAASVVLLLAGGAFAVKTMSDGDGRSGVAPASSPSVPAESTPGPAPSTSPDAKPQCSAQRQGLHADHGPQAGLPEAVENMRRVIAELAAACDYKGLEQLAGDDFSYRYGASGSAARYWRSIDRSEEITALMVKLLNTPYKKDDTLGPGAPVFYYWPAVHGPDPTERDFEALEGIYTDEEIQSIRDAIQQGGGYLGYRFGITDEGKWSFFLAGD